MANPLRGEVDVHLGEVVYTLRPTFNALCELEHVLNCGLLTLVKRFENQTFRLEDVATVIWAGTRSTHVHASLTREGIGEQLITHGIVNVLEPISQFLLNALRGLSGNKS